MISTTLKSHTPVDAWLRCSLCHLSVFLLLSFAVFPGPTAKAQVAGAITVYPGGATIEVGTSRQLSAYVPISPNTIIWSVNDIVGGNSTIGTISATGFYQAPATAPNANLITIKATSIPYPSSVGAATITITRKYPWVWSVSPANLVVGNYQVTFNGSNFAPDSQALANGSPISTVYFSSTKIVATGVAAQPGTITFAVRQPAPGAVTGSSVSAQVMAAPVTVAVNPGSATVQLDGTKTFIATVGGTANSAVTWSVNGVAGGSAAGGFITSTGIYTAPSVMPVSSSVTIRATSVAVPSSFASAAVTLIPVPPTVTVSVAPASVNVQLPNTQPFVATVTGSANTSVTWSVNGVAGGSAAAGSITASGIYTPPAVMPASAFVTISATSVANPATSAQAAVTLLPPVTVAVSPSSSTLALGNNLTFSATVTGSANPAVTWTVNGILGGSTSVGTISSAGLYSAPAGMPASSTVTIRATSVAAPGAFAQVTVTLTAPPPAPVWLHGARFLEQSSFGPTPATLAKIQQIGIQAYLDEQFTLPETVIPTPADNGMGTLRQWALYNYSTAQDQLRQRVAYALGQIVVTSANKLVYADEILPWLRLLSKHAFGNYRDFLREITRSPSMGKYLDLANSVKPNMVTGANENYARELMQLFTIGLWELNQDGSLLTDPNGPISTYDQNTVRQVALALTGWTYPTAPGATPQSFNWEYFAAPMETRSANHDMTQKTFLGKTLAAGQSVSQDLESLLDALMTHPNIAPFIATRLIRSLVTSNPSPGYIQRVASVFADNGNGVAGDLKAVVTAILMDSEARNDVAAFDQGRLKEPILHIAGFLRALNGGFTSGQQLTYLFDYMAQPILTPNSVFSWFSPLYRIPHTNLFGPEFQIYSPTEAVLRGNFFYSALNYPAGDMIVDLTPFQPYGNNMPALVEAANQALFYGRMPAQMKQILINAATPGYDAKTRIETVLYLTALSGQYAVQY